MPGFDGLDDLLECGHVHGVAGEHLVGQREALGGDQLLAAGAVVAGTAAPGLRHPFGGALEVGAGQIVGDEAEVGGEQGLPPGGQVRLERLLVFDQVIQAAVQASGFGHPGVAVRQHVHGGLREPFFVDIQLAARGQQPVDAQQLQHLLPGHFAALPAEPLPPEPVQPELAPQPGGRPAVAEAPRLAHPQGRGPHLDDVVARRRAAFAIGEQPALEQLAVVLADDIQRVPPTALLAGAEFAQVQDLALDRAPAVHPQAFAHRIVDMLLAVLAPDPLLQEHAPSNHDAGRRINRVGRPTGGVEDPPQQNQGFQRREKCKTASFARKVTKLG